MKTESAIYYIGGASGAGKTTSSQRLATAFQVPIVELDDFQRALMRVLPDLERRGFVTRALSRTMLLELLKTKVRCIVEGSWLEPAEAAALRAQYPLAFHPVYCGYIDADLDVRYATLTADGQHWLARKSRQEAFEFLERQLANSKTFAEACGQLQISYFDFTSQEAGYLAVEADFRRWHESLPIFPLMTTR